MGIADFFSGRGILGKPSQQQPIVIQAPTETKQEETKKPSTADWFKPSENDYKPTQFDASKLFDLTPDKVQEFQQTISKTNFLQNITPEQLQAIQGGGEDATKTMLALVNSTAQQALAASIQASMQMVQGAMAKASETVDTRVDHLTREQRFTNAIKEANPALKSESAGFIVDSLKSALMAKFPNASEAEIKDHVNTYIQEFTSTAVPQVPSERDQQAGKDTDDWSEWAEAIESRHE